MDDRPARRPGAPADELIDLSRVLGHFWTDDANPPRNRYFALEFEFANAVLVAEVDPDYDEVFLRIEQEVGQPLRFRSHDEEGTAVADLCAQPWWPKLDQARAGWRWVLQNQQGHQDGAQIEFVRPEQGGTVVQLVAMASALEISLVNPLYGSGPEGPSWSPA